MCVCVRVRVCVKAVMYVFSTTTGRSLHCKVEQPHVNTLHVKNYTFYIKHHQNGSKFYQFFSRSRYTWYLLNNNKMMTKFDDVVF